MKKAWMPVIVPGTEQLLMPAIPEDGKGNNDFCIQQDDNGTWHIFSITWYDTPEHPKPRCYLSHATAPDFSGPWTRQPYIYLSPTNNWAPHIVRDRTDPSIFLMFLGGMGHDTLRCYESDSKDLFNWKLRQDLGQELGTRDPMILYVEQEDTYYMYTTFTTHANGNVGIAVSTSKDLHTWRILRIIPVNKGEVLDESPFVVYKDGYYYLWATWSSRSYHLGIPTRIFRSEFPDFKEVDSTGEEYCIASWPVHAVEIVDANNKSYLCRTGTGGPGIVASELHWSEDGQQKTISAQELAFDGIWNNDVTDYYSSQSGDSFSLNFTGRRIEFRGSKGMDGGYCEIFLDGESQGRFNQFACDYEFFEHTYRDAFMWTSKDLVEGEHTLRVVVTGEKTAISSNCRVYVNRIVVTK